MRRIASWAAFAAAGAGVGIVVGAASAPGVRAAKAVAQLDVVLAPNVVESRASSQAFLSIRNAGAVASKLVLGDQIDLTYSAGATSANLCTTGTSLTSQDLPAGVILQPLAESKGVRLVVQTDVTIDAGATILVPFDFTAGEPGVAPLVADLRLGKSAGKYLKRVETRVAKTPPRADLFFGDGHDGDLVVTGDVEIPNTGSFAFADVTIQAGGRLVVPSGATIRCTGTFTNSGTLLVRPGNPGGTVRLDAVFDPGVGGVVFDPSKQLTTATVPADRGDALSAASWPALMAETQASSGAYGGIGLGTRVRRLPLSSFRTGGGGGTGGFGALGGDGGGIVRILARGDILNGGSILAAGTAPSLNRAGSAGGGAGGGGGGIVILGSASRVSNTGSIDARGGNAGPPDGYGGGGGPGGGGFVALVSPVIEGNGSALVTAGQGFLHSGNVSALRSNPSAFLPVWIGGGGGGACVGNGGDGHGVSATGVLDGIVDSQSQPVVPRTAGDGDVLHVAADPRTVW